MQDEHIEEMVRRLKPKDIAQAKAILRRYWRWRMALVWVVADIHRAANERGLALTNHEAVTILQELHQRYNPQLGLRWTDLWDYFEAHQNGRKLTCVETNRFVKQNQVIIAK